MNDLIWLAFEESALSSARIQQIRALAQTMQAHIVIVTDSQYEALAHLSDISVIVEDNFVSKMMKPAHASMLLSSLFFDYSVCAVLAPHSPRWLRILSILAAAREWPMISNICTRDLPNCTRLICAGRVIEKMFMPTVSFMGTLALDVPSASKGVWPICGRRLTTDDAISNESLLTFYPEMTVSFEPFELDTDTLDMARVVFAGGRGLGSKQNFDRLVACAEKYGAAVAASRVAVDLGWCRNDMQVGQTGRAIHPDVYIAFGISGAIQHLAGIKNARKIIAINTDKDAPIFRYADYGVVTDVNRVIERMLSK